MSHGRLKTIGQLAEASGVSVRTLRFYEEKGFLSPARTESGYRLYSERDERRLAQVMAMRSCGLPLATIGRLLGSASASGSGKPTGSSEGGRRETGNASAGNQEPEADLRAALLDHLRSLRTQGRSLEAAVQRTRAALNAIERMHGMETKDAFEELKRQGLESFEREYGQEARQRYGADAIEQSNARMMGLTRDEWDAKELLEESIKVQLRLAMATDDPAGDESQELARMHERWIAIHWGPGYAEEAYLGLVRGYLADPRFVSYYDTAAGQGATEFLVKAVEAAHHAG